MKTNRFFETLVEAITRDDKDYQLLKKLDAMTVERGCTPAEAEVAKAKAKAIKEKLRKE